MEEYRFYWLVRMVDAQHWVTLGYLPKPVAFSQFPSEAIDNSVAFIIQNPILINT